MANETDLSRFWRNVLRAAEAEPKDATVIKGASGIEHSIVAVGLDESRRRLLVVSGEHDAHSAAMAQIDIQSALNNFQVLVARPIAVDLSVLAKGMVEMTGRTTFSQDCSASTTFSGKRQLFFPINDNYS